MLLTLIIYIFFHITNRGNSYGILKFKLFATSSMNFWLHGPITFSLVLNYTVYTLGSRCRFFFLTLIFIFLQRTRGNLYGISKFKSFATWSSFSPKLRVPTNVILVLCYGISNSGQLLYLTFCNLRILSFALDIVKILMEFRHSNNLELSPTFLGGTYQLTLFRFYVKPFSNYRNPL